MLSTDSQLIQQLHDFIPKVVEKFAERKNRRAVSFQVSPSALVSESIFYHPAFATHTHTHSVFLCVCVKDLIEASHSVVKSVLWSHDVLKKRISSKRQY